MKTSKKVLFTSETETLKKRTFKASSFNSKSFNETDSIFDFNDNI